MAAEGLRERKKRQTRQTISDIATWLFMERGFDAVTIAEIAEAAQVSVNTVYNYFPAKEDLFLDRQSGVVERLPRVVRGRAPGESAARAVLDALRREVVAVSPTVGLIEGFDRFMRVIEESSALKSRMWRMRQEILAALTATLAEEAGAEEGDPLPELVAGHLALAQSQLLDRIGRELMEGGSPSEVSRRALDLLDEIEDLLGERVLGYATKPTP